MTEYLLTLANSARVVWEGASGADAAARYTATFPGRVVVASRKKSPARGYFTRPGRSAVDVRARAVCSAIDARDAALDRLDATTAAGSSYDTATVWAARAHADELEAELDDCINDLDVAQKRDQ